MEIYVQEDGSRGFNVLVQSQDTVRMLKEAIWNAASISPSDQILVYHGLAMRDDLTMMNLRVGTKDRVDCFVRSKNPDFERNSHSASSGYRPDFRSIKPPASAKSSFLSNAKGKGPIDGPSFSSSSRPPRATESDQGWDWTSKKKRIESGKRANNQFLGVQVHSTIIPVLQSQRKEPLHPFELSFLTREETQDRILFWKREAQAGNFDPDTHIVDPIAHYSQLDYLEESVVTNSEYYRCRGVYNAASDDLYGWSRTSNTLQNVPDWIWDLMPNELMTVEGHSSVESIQRISMLESLWKSYMILCCTLNSFNEIEDAGFCKGFYSMLAKHPEPDVAQLVRITRGKLEELKTGLESCISVVYSGILSVRWTERTLVNMLATGNWFLNELHMFRSSNSIDISPEFALFLCRLVVLLLDLGLVSYIGSHGSQFGSFINSNADDFIFSTGTKKGYVFTCSLRSLACLDGLLDSRVWIFKEKNRAGDLDRPDSKLSILTSIDLFADIWGPAWSVTNGNAPRAVEQYILSRGCIRPVTHQGTQIQGAISCHWTMSNIYNSEPSRYAGDSVELFPDDLLLIGAALKEDPNCPYKSKQYEQDFGHLLGNLGTVEGTWRLDAVTLGLNLGMHAVLGVAGTYKRMPEVSLKELVYAKFALSPRTANINYLNNVLGVEISHSTGNARRIKLKDLLRLKQVQGRLQAYYPGWERTLWGAEFLNALDAPDFEAMRRLWTESAEKREDIAKLITPILELLHHTGERGNDFIAAYLNGHDDQYIPLRVELNDWAKCLPDSPRMATYAVIGDVCLKYALPPLTLCNQEERPTVLQLDILFHEELPQEGDHVSLLPSKTLLKVVGNVNGRKITLTTSGNILRPTIKAMVMVASPESRSKNLYSAIILASANSFGGMSQMRKAVRRKELRPVVAKNAPRRHGANRRDPNRASNGNSTKPRRTEGKRRPEPQSACCTVL